MIAIPDLDDAYIAALTHQHALQLMASDPALEPQQALRKAYRVIVLAYDLASMKAGLAEAAKDMGVPDELARLAPPPPGGATLALTQKE